MTDVNPRRGSAARHIYTAVAMDLKRWFSSRLFKELAGWLCLLAVIALVTVATSGALQSVLTLAAVVPAIWAMGLPRGDSNVRPERKPAPLLVVLAPVFVGLTIASVLAPDEWYWFTAIAVVFPLAVVWRHMYRRWEDGRVPPDTA
jgi:hypothetical protein